MQRLNIVINAAIPAIMVDFNTDAFDCRVGKTLQMYNRVTNSSDMGIFSKWAWEIVYTALFPCHVKGNVLPTMFLVPSKQLLDHNVFFLNSCTFFLFLLGKITVSEASSIDCLSWLPAVHHNSPDEHYQVRYIRILPWSFGWSRTVATYRKVCNL